MSISLEQTDKAESNRFEETAARLVGDSVAAIEPIGGGRNSKVYRVTGMDARMYVLKVYFRHHADSRDRLWTEFCSLQFLRKNSVSNVPGPLAADRDQNCALYEYVDGEQVAPGTIGIGEIQAAVSFLDDLRILARQTKSHWLPVASEACFSGQALESNLRERLGRLSKLPDDSASAPGLRIFLVDEFVPALEAMTRWARSRLAWDQDLEWTERTLSPSDFGFHNALRRPDGRLIFLDFEYFGWDDPAKTLSDFLLHPAMDLTDTLKKRFAIGLLDLFGSLPRFVERVESVYPLYGLKWCLILLNEFLPDQMLRRQFAQTDNSERYVLQTEQLSKARRMLERIKGDYEHFPYFS